MGILDSIGFSAGLGALGSVASSWMNWESQKETNATMVNLADTAVQRRAADLKAAGMNPVLAAGSAASVPQLGAPKVENPVPAALGAATNAANIAVTQAQAQKTAAEARSASADADLKEAWTYGTDKGTKPGSQGMAWQQKMTEFGRQKALQYIESYQADYAQQFQDAGLSKAQADARAARAGADAAEQNVEMNKIRIEQLQLARDIAQKQNNWYVVQQIESILSTLLGGAKSAIGAAAGAGMLAVPY